MSNKLLMSALAVGSLLATGLVSTQAAQAITLTPPGTVTINQGDAGKFTIYSYGGSVDHSNLSGPTFTPDLNAKILFNLLSFNGTDAIFDVTVSNDSGGDLTASRITIFGFDVIPTGGSFSRNGSSSEAPFSQIGGRNPNNPNVGGQVPQSEFLGFDRLDVCFRAGGNGNGCTGGGTGGIAQGNTSDPFQVVLNFVNGVDSFDLTNFYVRYQGIRGEVDGIRVAGASGVGTAGIIPTPAMLPGLIGMGAAAFRKKKEEELEEV